MNEAWPADTNQDGKLDQDELAMLNMQLNAATRERKLEEQSTRLSQLEREQLLRLQMVSIPLDGAGSAWWLTSVSWRQRWIAS